MANSKGYIQHLDEKLDSAFAMEQSWDDTHGKEERINKELNQQGPRASNKLTDGAERVYVAITSLERCLTLQSGLSFQDGLSLLLRPTSSVVSTSSLDSVSASGVSAIHSVITIIFIKRRSQSRLSRPTLGG
ncbi:hypothetical protein CRG98_039930 [Punica granatum]|uniref:Uncharacterized protein n=1 Tax=Punica granatum TaxID=22663 RepID=A0A2I0I6P9_PUNGR|nr:hypothetical protein CRG98_039930 [Punica granatum]